MGGNAFPRTANRLSTPQLNKLTSHGITSLKRFFVDLQPLKNPRDKVDHGDLDLICGWHNEKAWNWKGEERGSIVDPETKGGKGIELGFEWKGIKKVNEPVLEKGKGDGVQEQEGEEIRLRGWCFDICRAVRAVDWVRRGSEISLAIPCSVLGEHIDDAKAFYQLDLPLVPAKSLDFYLLTVSYSTTFLILARAVRCISKSLTLQMTGLIIKQPVYNGLPGVDIQLTSDAHDFCDYLGLDYEKWLEVGGGGGFETELDCWRWLVDLKRPIRLFKAEREEQGKAGESEKEEEEVNLDIAYKKMIRPREVRQKGHKSRAGKLDEFLDFLRTETKYKEDYQRILREMEEKEEEEQAENINSTPALSPTVDPSISGTVLATPSTMLLAPMDRPLVDPDQPLELSPRAQASLDRWGKRKEYETSVAERKVKAVELAARQKKTIEGKIRAAELARRKEMGQFDDEELLVKNLGSLNV